MARVIAICHNESLMGVKKAPSVVDSHLVRYVGRLSICLLRYMRCIPSSPDLINLPHPLNNAVTTNHSSGLFDYISGHVEGPPRLHSVPEGSKPPKSLLRGRLAPLASQK